MRTVWLAWLVALGACTERNPEFCGDGTCVDPSRPYCDFHGDFQEQPGTCIAVTCTPGEFALCRGESTVACNETGNGYAEVMCELGCNAGAKGCRDCIDDDGCDGGLVCEEATGTCIACATDDDCESRVCDIPQGTCVSGDEIVYASPSGSPTAPCSLAIPCSLLTGLTTVRSSQVPLLLRMLPGNYLTSIELTTPSALPVRIVATGANITVVGPKAAIVADGGAVVEIRNLSSSSEDHVSCGLASTSAPISRVRLSDSSLVTVGMGKAFEAQRCDVEVFRTEISSGASGSTIFAARDDTSYVADRLIVRAGTNNQIITSGSRIKMTVTNAILERTQVMTFLNDSASPGSSFEFNHVAFTEMGGGSDMCSGATFPFRTMRVLNSFVTGSGVSDAFDNPNPANCTFENTIINRQASGALPGTTIADPQFVDPATSDYRLLSTSPGLDAATSSAITYDVVGTTRPQGAAPDIGAYERIP